MMKNQIHWCILRLKELVSKVVTKARDYLFLVGLLLQFLKMDTKNLSRCQSGKMKRSQKIQFKLNSEVV